MASASLPSRTPPLSEDQFHCAICLEVFTDPVTTSCGHNFCKVCIDECWDKVCIDSSKECKCPVCKKTFVLRPELCVNTALRDIVILFKTGSSLDVATPGEVQSEPKSKTVKSSLDCGASRREEHLEPHKSYRSMDLPIGFNSTEQTSVYVQREDLDHSEGHTAPLDSERTEKKVPQNVQKLEEEGEDVTSSTEASNVQRTVESQQDEAEFVTSSTEDSKVQQNVQSQQEKVELVTSSTEASNLQQNVQSQQEKVELVTSSTEASNVPQDVQSQQEEAEVITTPPAERHNRSQSLPQMTLLVSLLVVFIGWLVYRYALPPLTLTQSARTGSKEPSQSLHLHRPKQRECSQTPEDMQQLIQDCLLKFQKDTFSTDLNKILAEEKKAMQSECELRVMQKYKVSVTLDPDTAYPFLILSEDGKQVRHANTRQNVPDNPIRFQYAVGVLGKEGFSCGRFYYEVQVKNKTKWDVGVAAQSIDRRGKGRVIASPENGQWTVSMKRDNEYVANTNPQVPISLSQKPQKVGVFVDYEEGQVSFYDVENRSHIYSFAKQTFNEKMYPFFNPGIDWDGMNSSPLVITPVNQRN